MRTVWLLMCSTVAPMARGGGGDIPGNNLGQGFTSPSTFTHAPGAYGARTGAVGGAADRRLTVTTCTSHSRTAWRYVLKLHGRTQGYVLSAPVKSARTTLSRSQMAGTRRFHLCTSQPLVWQMAHLLEQRAPPRRLDVSDTRQPLDVPLDDQGSRHQRTVCYSLDLRTRKLAA